VARHFPHGMLKQRYYFHAALRDTVYHLVFSFSKFLSISCRYDSNSHPFVRGGHRHHDPRKYPEMYYLVIML